MQAEALHCVSNPAHHTPAKSITGIKETSCGIRIWQCPDACRYTYTQKSNPWLFG